MADIGEALQKSHAGVIQKAGELNKALHDLRYEGKPMFGKNLRRARTVFRSLEKELSKDMRFEEKVLFPFLESHVPKLRFMIHIIEEEHGDLRGNLEALQSLLEKLLRAGYDGGQSALVEKIRRKGNYLNYFLHNHTWAENESVYRVMSGDLIAAEKKELQKRFDKFKP